MRSPVTIAGCNGRLDAHAQVVSGASLREERIVTDSDVQYEFKAVQTVRGTEARSIAKWQNEGWEYVGQAQGRLSTTLNFRRVKPKTFNDYLAGSVAAFRRMPAKAQVGVAGVTAAIVGASVIGIAVGAQGSSADAQPSAALVAPTQEPSEPSPGPTAGVGQATVTPTPETEADEPDAAAYVYNGPAYEIHTVDDDAGMGELDQYWIYTDPLDYSTDAYKEQIRLLIADVARKAGTTELLVEVVTDEEVIEANSAATIADFMNSKGMDYYSNVVRPKEATDWVASYTGGIDLQSGELSSSDAAFEIVWWIGADDPEFDQWQPEIAG